MTEAPPYLLIGSPDGANLPVRIALEALALPYERRPVDRAGGEHREAAYLALNPQGLIPVLIDGDRPIFETGAILLHLAEAAGRHGPAGPAMGAPGLRPRLLKWLFYLSNTVHADFRVGVRPDRYVPEGMAGALREGVAARLEGHLDLIEAQLPERGGLVAETPGIVEIYLACLVRWAQLYPIAAPLMAGIGERPRLRALAGEIEAWPAARAAAEGDGIPPDAIVTAPRRPDLPAGVVTG